MFTNTFAPHVGGVARSVQGFTEEYRRRGERVMVVAPTFEGTPDAEKDVVRFPAIQEFNGSDFSVPVPVPVRLRAAIELFRPDIVHSHHPFLLGDTALRVAAQHELPVVFTHHTMYERYTHYVPGDSPAMKRAVIELAVGYCNLADAVIAPSESTAKVLRERGVTTPIEVIPSGVAIETFAGGDGATFRKRYGIPADAWVVGHVGRLAPEKNLDFLARATAALMTERPEAHFLVVGEGPATADIVARLAEGGLGDRLHLAGVLGHDRLGDAYAAMDVFAFASQTETQGMVLTEAMAAGVPVVAIAAPGASEVVIDGCNGRRLPGEDLDSFAAALEWVASLDAAALERLRTQARMTADRFSMAATAGLALDLYRSLIEASPLRANLDESTWVSAKRRLREEWKILSNVAHAAGGGLRPQSRHS